VLRPAVDFYQIQIFRFMFQIIFAILLAWASHGHTQGGGPNHQNMVIVADTGGESGDIPPTPPPPQP
jgi:hypothetical protein